MGCNEEQPKMSFLFQSPRTGKFESNSAMALLATVRVIERFNPLERGNSNQIHSWLYEKVPNEVIGFNPLKRGNSNQI